MHNGSQQDSEEDLSHSAMHDSYRRQVNNRPRNSKTHELLRYQRGGPQICEPWH
jgi:hypothetical protein